MSNSKNIKVFSGAKTIASTITTRYIMYKAIHAVNFCYRRTTTGAGNFALEDNTFTLSKGNQ